MNRSEAKNSATINKMKKYWKRTRKSHNKLLFFLIVISISILTFFIPKISSTVLKIRRQKILNNFISTLELKKEIDGQKFWKFREFYSPGYFTYNQINVDYIQPLVIINNQKTNDLTAELLTYNSKLIISHEGLVDKNVKITELIDDQQTGNLIIDTKKLILYKRSDGYELYFLKSIDEMMETNGLFDYSASERELLNKKAWFNHTYIKVH